MSIVCLVILCSLRPESRDSVEATEHARLTSGLLAKLLQRGYAPLATLEIEHAALSCNCLIKEVTDLAEGEVEVGWQFPPEKAKMNAAVELRKELIRRDPCGFSTSSQDNPCCRATLS